MTDPLLAWRERFPTLADSTHLISHSLGAMPESVFEALRRYAECWAADSIEAWHTWLPLVTETGDLVGSLIGAPKGSVMMHTNVSTIMALVASALDFEAPGDKKGVVYTDLNFTTVHYVWQQQARRGAKLTIVKSPDGIHVPTEAIVQAIDETTLVVPISLVYFQSSALQDIAPIVARAHEVGAFVVLDAYQATGTVPFDVTALDLDFCCGGSVKWLCGGPGACYLYVRPDLTERFEPMQCGWFSHARPFAFEFDTIDYAPDIQRYMGGTPGVPALYAAREGYRIVGEIGVERIRQKSQRQTERLYALAEAAGFTVNTPRDPARRGGTVCVQFDGSGEVAQELLRRRFFIDHRPNAGIRISPHFYTTDEEVERVMREIAAIRAAR